jgi:hypothetical protein
METTAFDLLIVPTLWVTLGGIIVGAVLLSLIQSVENALKHLGGARDDREPFPTTARDLLPRPARHVTRRAMRLHG